MPETYTNDDGDEACEECQNELFYCTCTCDRCGDNPHECACDEEEPVDDDAPADDGQVCINDYPEHNEQITYEGPDGVAWRCTRCDVDGWDPAEEPTP